MIWAAISRSILLQPEDVFQSSNSDVGLIPSTPSRSLWRFSATGTHFFLNNLVGPPAKVHTILDSLFLNLGVGLYPYAAVFSKVREFAHLRSVSML